MHRFCLYSSTISLPVQGLGIAIVAAQKAGVAVTLVDNSQASIDKGLKFAGSLHSSIHL
jgi:3-hydroxyacyl-CoA dehydrogenase